MINAIVKSRFVAYVSRANIVVILSKYLSFESCANISFSEVSGLRLIESLAFIAL